MSQWTSTELGSICDIRIGGTPSRSNSAYWDTDHSTENYWVAIRDLNKRVITDTAERLTNLGVKHSNAKLIPKGTILLSFKLTIGRVAFAGRDLYTNEAIAALVTDQLDSNYFYYGLQHWDLLKGVDQAVKGATLNKEKLKHIEITYPEYKTEQAQIAAVLSCIDSAIEQTEAIIAKQQRIKIGLMQDLLTKGIDEHGNIRSEETHKFKDSVLGKIPTEWEIKTAGELCLSVIDCKNRTPPVKESGHPVIRTPNVRDGQFVEQDLVYTDEASYGIWTQRGKPRPGDVLITREAPVGEVCILPDSMSDACLGQRMMLYRPAPSLMKKSFMLLALLFEGVQQHLRDLAGGSTVGHVRVGDIKSLVLPKPSLEEQEQIANLIDGITNQIKASKEQFNKLNKLKAGLMQDLLAGKVSVKALLETEQYVVQT
jgi:type I restriction enzyme S subunit